MMRWLRDLDDTLRGQKTRLTALEAGEIDISAAGMIAVILLLGAIYGVCMGTYALLREDGPVYIQVVASAVKVPALFLLTLLITFPSLYVFNTLVGSRLRLGGLLRLLLASIGVTAAMLAAFGPIVAFFSVSTESYPFMVLLNVAVFAIAGAMGLAFLLQTLHRLTLVDEMRATSARVSAAESSQSSASGDEQHPSVRDTESPLDPIEGRALGAHVKQVFYIWMLVYGLVGAQMGWVLRPFVGNPNQPFSWFRERESNVFEGIWHALINLFV